MKSTATVFRSVFASTFLLFGFGITSVSASGEDPAAQLNQLMEKMNSISGDFTQIITDDEQEVVEENDGNFILKRPGFFRWHIAPPFEKVIVSNQQSIWTYDPDLEQVVVETVSDQLLQSPMTLLSGDLDKIKANFTVTVLESSKNGEQQFQLIPTAEDGAFNKMLIKFKDQRLSGMVLYSALGETQSYVFSSLEFNKAVDDSAFKFVPPADVDVLVND